MDNSTTVGGEDHPSFDFYGANDDLVVAGVGRNGSGTGTVALVHYPDLFAPPVPASVGIGRISTTSEGIDHPDIEAGDGMLWMVFRDGGQNQGRIRHAECDMSAAVDCTDPLDWTTSIIMDSATVPAYHYDADAPELAMEFYANAAEKQFVLWHYDANAGVGDPSFRVILGERCVGGGWSFEEIRPAPDLDAAGNPRSQTNKYGRPSIVLNRVDNIVHVVFAEVEDYPGGFKVGSAGDLYWMWRSYDDCQ